MRFQILPGTQNAIWTPEQEEISMLAVQLASKFLFQVGFHTKKTLRGPASDWHEILSQHFRCSQTVRAWFAMDLFKHPHRLCDYLLSCPSVEVRIAFMKIVVYLAHFSMQDPPLVVMGGVGALSGMGGAWWSREEVVSLSEQILCAVRALASPAASDAHAHRHLPLLFHFFHTYATLGLTERHQLLRLKILDIVLTVCMDDSSSLGKYQYPESTKIHQVICVLARSCEVRPRCGSANAADGVLPLPNPYADPPETSASVVSLAPSTTTPAPHTAEVSTSAATYLGSTSTSASTAALETIARPTLPPIAVDVLFNRNGTYMKKLTEECCGCEDGIRLLQFLCWENGAWSRVALAELLWQMAYAYCHDLRRHADTLSALLIMEDSWQQHRIHNAIRGMADERPGLLETACRSRSHYQKRAYACMKLVVGVMARTPLAVRAVNAHADARRRWRQLLAWLQDELDRYGPGGYGSYGTWSPPSTSNDTSSGYFLERSNSARKTLERAYQLCPEEEDEEEEDDGKEGGEGSGSGEAGEESGDEEEPAAEDPPRRLHLTPAVPPAPPAPPAPAPAPAPATTTVAAPAPAAHSPPLVAPRDGPPLP